MYGESISQMLTVQYRMHEDIMAWSSRTLYQGKLTAHDSVATHTRATLPTSAGAAGAAAADEADADDDAAAPLVLVDTAGCDMEEQQEEEGGSRYNEGEAACVVTLVQSLLDSGLSASCIGVITPYSAQKSRCALCLHAVRCSSCGCLLTATCWT